VTAGPLVVVWLAGVVLVWLAGVVVWLAGIVLDAETAFVDLARHRVSMPFTTLNGPDKMSHCAESDLASIWYTPGMAFTDGHV
jgi:hypothetical protein